MKDAQGMDERISRLGSSDGTHGDQIVDEL